MAPKTKKGLARHGRRASPERTRPRDPQRVVRDINTLVAPENQRPSPEELALQVRQAFANAKAASEPSGHVLLDAQCSAILAIIEQTGGELNVKAAAHVANCSENTIRTWISRHNIGLRRGGRLIVLRGRLEALLAGVAQEADRG